MNEFNLGKELANHSNDIESLKRSIERIDDNGNSLVKTLNEKNRATCELFDDFEERVSALEEHDVTYAKNWKIQKNLNRGFSADVIILAIENLILWGGVYLLDKLNNESIDKLENEIDAVKMDVELANKRLNDTVSGLMKDVRITIDPSDNE